MRWFSKLKTIFCEKKDRLALFLARKNLEQQRLSRKTVENKIKEEKKRLSDENKEIQGKLNKEKEELKEERHKIEKIKCKLSRPEKLESLSQLASGVSHELNQPLASSRLWVSLLREMLSKEINEKDKEKMNEMLKSVEDDISSMDKIIRKLSYFAQQSKLKPTQINLNELIHRLLDMLGKKLKSEHITIKKELAPDLPKNFCDINQIEEVLINLISNSRDALAKKNGGTLTFKTKVHGSEEVILEVSDTGCGMSEDVQDRIFDPFYTTKGVGKGTGLGLSVIYGIMKQHNGKIEVKSEAGKGTICILTFPVAYQDLTMRNKLKGFIKLFFKKFKKAA